MEKQIVLREPGIEWRELNDGNKFVGYCNGLKFCTVARRSDGYWYIKLAWNNVNHRQQGSGAAKFRAEYLFTDWLRSIATITE